MARIKKTKDEKAFKTARFHPVIGILKFFAKFFVRKVRVEFSEPPEKDEPIVVCANHCREYGAVASILYYPRKARLWANANLFFHRRTYNHTMFYAFYDKKGIGAFFGKIAAGLAAIAAPSLVHGCEAIPTFYNDKLALTVGWSCDSLAAGRDVIIFPESAMQDEENPYINFLQNGFARIAPEYYKKTGKVVKFYPAYICKAHRKIIVGKPISFDPEINFKLQIKDVKQHLRDSIKEIALSLPPHEAVINVETLERSPEVWAKYVDKGIIDRENL